MLRTTVVFLFIILKGMKKTQFLTSPYFLW